MRGLLQTIACLGVATGTAFGQAEPDITREGAGERREALNAMELSRFDASLLEGLTDWVGTPVRPQDIEGRPVLLVTWASWHSASIPAARAAQQMAEQHGGKGLVVIGVHADEAYEGAADIAARRGIEFPFARDAGSKLREALKVDLDPDYYLVDRAGQLRYADIDRSALREATRRLVNESFDDAAGVEAKLESAAEQRMRDRQRIASVSRGDIAQIPDWTIAGVDAIAYDDADWPARWRDYESDTGGRFQSDRNRPVLDLNAGSVNWIGQKPNFQGRVIVVHYWSPTLLASYDGLHRYMGQLQKDYGRDVAVVSTIVPLLDVNPSDYRSNPERVAEAEQAFQRTIERQLRGTQFEQSTAFDREFEWLATSLNETSTEPRQILRRLQRRFPWPIVMLYSSDGTLRWMGTPRNDRFRAALDRMVAVDPAVQERRRLDAEFLARTGN
ncbi:MAG: TlpA disulfide reductase family protein [Planctomycetota bacterium]